MPRELQDYVTNTRERDYLNGLEQYKQGHQAYTQFHEVLQPYMPRITALGMHPAEAVRALLNADKNLSLQDAYDQAVWANPTPRAKAIEALNKETSEKARKEREAAAAAAQKARLANVRGKPTDKTTGAPKVGWEEALPVTAEAISKRT